LSLFNIFLSYSGVHFNDKQINEIVYQPESEKLLARTGVYVTSKWSMDDADATLSTLCANIERPNQYNTRDNNSKNFKSSNTWKLAEVIGTRMYQKYKNQLSSACNVDSVTGFVTMLYRHINRPLHYPKFGDVPCGAGFQSFDGILKKMNSAAGGAAVQGKVDSDSYVDGADVSVRNYLKQNRVSYEITPLACINREGSIWSLAVEVRFLMLAKALLGSRPAVSQMSIQCILDELTLWLVKDRLPSTIFCETKFITTHPDNIGSGLNTLSVPVENRPLTMIRPLPNTAVEENSAILLPAVVNGKLPEDFLVVGHLQRLADRVSDEKFQLHHTHVHLESLNAPSLPRLQWIPIQFVCKGDENEQDNFDGSTALYTNASLYFDTKTPNIILVRDTATAIVDPNVKFSPLQIDDNSSISRESIEIIRITTKKYKLLREALAVPQNEYVRFCPTFNREGILLFCEKTLSYCTLVAWPVENIIHKILKNTKTTNSVFFNPCCMSYLAMAQSAPTSGLSANIWPRVGPNAMLTTNIASCCRISNIDVESSMVHTGANIYIDLEHEYVPDFLKKNLVFKEVMPSTNADEMTPSGKNPISKSEYASRFAHVHPMHSLLGCMLMYSLPEQVVSRHSARIPNPIWVSVCQKQYANGKERKTVRHIILPTCALVPLERLHALGITPVLFESRT
jgi:hypothetical protein